MIKIALSLDKIEDALRAAEMGDPRSVITRDFVRNVRIACHPDLYIGDTKNRERADLLRRRVEDVAREMEQPPTVVKSAKRTYKLIRRIAIGDVSDVHLGEAEGLTYIVKVSRVVGGDRLLDAEAATLKAILSEATASNYDHYFPAFCESFPFRDSIAKRANTLIFKEGLHTLEEVHARHASLDGRHLAWIFKRGLTALGVAHHCGFVHGAIAPCHILISPEDHGLQLIAWGQSVAVGKPVKNIVEKYRDYYPQEVFKKKGALPSLDIYMLAKTILYLAGGEVASVVPHKLEAFLRSCLIEGAMMRPNDAWDLLDELDDVLREAYGPPKFVELRMN